MKGRHNSGIVAELRTVTKCYGQATALDNVSLSIRAGEILALLGPNGAGKTTAINVLLSLAQPTRGSAWLFGLPPHELVARRQVGAMLQDAVLDARVRVRETLALYSGYYPNPMPIDEALHLAGLAELAHCSATKLSGGQKQRLMFALALCGNPRLLFLDEPTAGLDVEARRALWKTLRTLAGQDRTILLTTHYLEEADALADRIVVLNHGRIIATGSPARIKARVALRRIRCVTRLDPDKVAALPEVNNIKVDGQHLEIATRQPEQVLKELLNLDPTLTDLEVTGAKLEDAFVELTRESAVEEAA